ncbi:MAG: MFS transporter [Actinomycetota bacterium]|nr:MFS transporter [Actinomycetota bacterium]
MTRTQRLTLIAAIMGSTVVFLDSTVVNVALPALSADLDAGLSGQQWVVEAYLLALVALLLVGGMLGDQYGRRKMFLFGLVGFAVTSALCAIAPSDEFLIIARGLQGIAGALLVPGSLALVASAFSGAARGAAVGSWTAWTGIATVVGPAGGGLLVDELDWRWIFWINLPLIAATIWLTLEAVEESRDPESVPGIDWTGIGLSALGLGGPVFALIEQPHYGWGDPRVWVPLASGVVLFALFLWHEATTRHPMLDLSLFRIRNFWVTNLVTLEVYAGLIGGLFFVTLFLQQTAGYSALQAGLATTPISVILFVLSSRFGRIASGTGPRLLMCVGPVVGGIGMLMMLRIGANPSYAGDVLPAVAVFGLGLAATVAPLTATVLDSVAERHAGIASGVNNGVSRVAGLLAIAILGAVISAAFVTELDESLPASSLTPAGAVAVEEVRDLPLGSAGTAELPETEANRIAASVSEASTGAFHLAVGIAGALMIAGGIAAGIGVQNPARRGEHLAPLAATAGDCGHQARAEEPVPLDSAA